MADLKDMLLGTPDHTLDFDPVDIENNKGITILAYLSWLVLIPLFVAKDSKFARFHCNQGIVLAIAELVIGFVIGILKGIPLLGWIFGILGGLVGLVCLVFLVLGILNVVAGRAKELPFIGGFKILS